MEQKHKLNMGYVIVAFWVIILFQQFIGHTASQVELSYSQFETYLENGWLDKIVIEDNTIRGTFKEPQDGKDHFVTLRVAPALVFFAVWFLLFRKFADKQGMGGMMNIGKSKAKVLVEKGAGVTAAGVGGVWG